jgi:hypothetical protein
MMPVTPSGPRRAVYRHFFALQARHIFVTIGEHAERINASSFQPVFATFQAYASEIPLREPVFLEQALARLGCRLDAFGEASRTADVVDLLLRRLPHYSENAALNALRTLREKRIAHPERLEANSLPTTTWENAETLLKIPIEALAVCGAYLSYAYVDDQGRLFMDTDVRTAATATRRLLRETGIVPS